MKDLSLWEQRFEQMLLSHMLFDAAHDLAHIKRVVSTARKIAITENADLNVVIPAAWLHDCVNIPKNSKHRDKGSLLSAKQATDYLKRINYPEHLLPKIHHAIHAHSFSANIRTKTIEAEIVQDADRLDALGAIGIARCVAFAAEKGIKLYCDDDPFAKNRELDEKSFAVDHFYTKLFKLELTMKTVTGQMLAMERTEYMKGFIAQLGSEM